MTFFNNLQNLKLSHVHTSFIAFGIVNVTKNTNL